MIVTIDNYDALEMLMSRLKFWTDDYITTSLFETYYENLIEEGCFDGREFDVMSIVDNDYVNWCDVITKDDFEDYNIVDENDESIVAVYDDEDTRYYLIHS